MYSTLILPPEQVFYWLFNMKERVRSKVQVLKDCLVYIRELEKRVDPDILREVRFRVLVCSLPVCF